MLASLFALSFVTAIYADYGIAALPLVFVAVAALVEWIIESASRERQGAILGIATTLLADWYPPIHGVSHLSDGTLASIIARHFAKITATAARARRFLTWPLILQRTYAPALRGYELPTTTTKLDSTLTRERAAQADVRQTLYGIVGDDQGAIATWLTAHCRQVQQRQRPRLDYRVITVSICGIVPLARNPWNLR